MSDNISETGDLPFFQDKKFLFVTSETCVTGEL